MNSLLRHVSEMTSIALFKVCWPRPAYVELPSLTIE